VPDIAIIPCIFPDDQGIRRGELFASDCVIRHTVWHVSIHFGEAMKSAHGARFTRSHGPGECQRPRQTAKADQNSLFAILACPSANWPDILRGSVLAKNA